MHSPQPLKGCTVCCYCSSSSLSVLWKAQLAEFPAGRTGHRDGHIPKIPQGPLEGLSTPGCCPCAPGDITNVPWDGDRVTHRDFLPGHRVGCEAGTENVPVAQPGEETLSQRLCNSPGKGEKMQKSGLEAKDW